MGVYSVVAGVSWYHVCGLTLRRPSKSKTKGDSPKLASTISPGVCSPTVGYRLRDGYTKMERQSDSQAERERERERGREGGRGGGVGKEGETNSPELQIQLFLRTQIKVINSTLVYCIPFPDLYSFHS